MLLPETDFVTAIDLGDWPAPDDCIHPRRKFEVARRLWLQVSSKHYGNNVVSQGPMVEEIVFNPSAQTATITF